MNLIDIPFPSVRRTFKDRDFIGDDRVLIAGGKVAHIVTSDSSKLWRGEAMTLCGRLAVAAEDIPDEEFNAPTCKTCERRLYGNG